MLSRAVIRAVPKATPSAARGFHATRAQLSSPYHYPEGPISNLPFNPKSKFFGAGYWSFMLVGFFTPFGIAAWKQSKAAAA
ncbi:hypothetical protein F5X68DRAFT_198371 [Plectosphaerella plurivora]|uniref:Cytochrome c oxidase subunit 8, mitochondrial n=1 Tax=Plectosphaerella plurivora TaxID=936078 RepID=A0A9P8VK32_9PEZI|nr:hypothetical protein F5X68DRAFT_198371 [Plectosphaerella plurivora]